MKTKNIENIYDFASILNNREYRNEITEEECTLAKELGFIIVLGYSDDTTLIKGAIDDEFSSYNGGEVFLSKNGIMKACECNCGYYQDAIKDKKTLQSIWCDGEYTWSYEINDIPFCSFDILENGEKYCKGIIFNINSL